MNFSWIWTLLLLVTLTSAKWVDIVRPEHLEMKPIGPIPTCKNGEMFVMRKCRKIIRFDMSKMPKP